jgi:hypothetical protein
MSLKNLLLKNFFTYKIYIYYNLYIRNKAYKKREYYSQWGEDLFIQKYFKDKIKGFYLDIGCFHPIMYSNTFLLFNKGWSGINIDLNQTSIDLFDIMRPKDYNICAAISNTSQSCDLFFDHNFSPVNTIEQSFYEESDKKVAFKKLIKKKIITKKFDDVVKKIPKLPKINFLNIDCEGHDYNILSSIDLNRYSPELICIETHKTDNKIHNKDIIKLLNHYKYKIFKRCGPSSLFIK